MATSGSFNTGSYTASGITRYLTFSWEIVSQSVENNTSTISWSLTGAGTSGWMMCGGFKVIVDGETVYSKSTDYRVQVYAGTVIAGGTKILTHNDDGTRSFSASAEAGIYTYAVNKSGSGTFTLDTIARASQPSLVTWPDTTNNVGNFGEEFSIHMNRKSSAFTHTVRYAYGDRTGTIATDVGTGTTWTVPLSFMNDIPNATSASGRIYVDTYNGSTLVGTKYTGFTVTVPSSVKPSCSFTLEDITGVDDTYGSPVKGLSRIKVTVSSTLAYSSPIASIVITANGVRYTTSPITTGVLLTAGTSTVTATVTDKRGRSGSVTYDMTVQDYSPPTISALTVLRCGEDGTANDRGEYIKATYSCAVHETVSDNGTSMVRLKYKKTSETEDAYVVADLWDDIIALTDQVAIFPADVNSAYDVLLTVDDTHNLVSRSTQASTAFTLMNWGATGTSVAFGKVSEKDNTMEIALDVEFIGKVTGAIFDAIYPVGSIYTAYNHTNPSTLFGGTWERISNAFLWGCDSTGTIGQTGGEKTHTLNEDEIPMHCHGGTYTNAGSSRTHAWLTANGSSMGYEEIFFGGDMPHNNMPPYIQVSIWRRTA